MGFLLERIDFFKSLWDINRDEWIIAIRKRSTDTLYQGNNNAFKILKNTLRYWAADPFLFTYDNKDWLFAELYDRKHKKGVIGVARIKNNRIGRFRVILDLKYHLSYPCIFMLDDRLCMMPECYESGKVTVYQATGFPYKWEEKEVLINGIAVDTTPLFLKENKYFVTTHLYPDNHKNNDNLHLYKYENGVCRLINKIVFGTKITRQAGHFIQDGDRLLRVAQDCSKLYGGNLSFFEIENINENSYSERLINCILPNSVKIEGGGYTDTDFIGIHTYNSNEKYEVIDLKYSGGKNIYYFIRNFKNYIKNKRKNSDNS